MLYPQPSGVRHPLSMCFVCVENAARSQMAEALARTMLDPVVEIFSAGFNPGAIDAQTVAVMAEIGIDIRAASPKHFAQIPLERVANLVVMCPSQLVPRQSSAIRVLHWGIADPAVPDETGDESPDQVLARYRRTRDRIAYRLRSLLAELELRVSSAEDESELDAGGVQNPRRGGLGTPTEPMPRFGV